MNQLELKIYPDPCLRVKCRPVEKFTGEISEIVRGMEAGTYVYEGIGLAANQVGIGLCIFMADLGGDKLVEFINPQVVEKAKKKTKMEEGCLSLPDIKVYVSRPEWVEVRAQNRKGEFFIDKYEGLSAKVIQHEMDHLEGRLIIDYLGPARKLVAAAKLRFKKGKK